MRRIGKKIHINSINPTHTKLRLTMKRFFIEYPHCGQACARLENSLPHLGHVMSAMALSIFFKTL